MSARVRPPEQCGRGRAYQLEGATAGFVSETEQVKIVATSSSLPGRAWTKPRGRWCRRGEQ